MRGFLLGLVTGIALTALAAASVAFYYLRSPDRPPPVKTGSTLVLRLSGPIPEKQPFVWPGTPNRSLTMFAVWDVLRKAAADPRIKELILVPEGVGAGWAKLAEIRASIELFRQSGKPVSAFLRTPSGRDYFLAAAASRISMPPGDLLNLKGLRVELLYARKALDKLGILPEFEAIGKYKDGADTLTRGEMSPTTREVIDELLDARYRDLVEGIAKARNKTPEQVRALIDQGPFLAEEALKHGLVDTLQHEDQVLPPDQSSNRVSAADYQHVRALSLRLAGPARIAFLAAEGDILRAPIPGVSDDVLSPDSFRTVVRQLAKDTGIKAVILRIDSPGGDAIASDEMLRELNLLAAKKPLVVSMSDLAASGGYAIALAGSPIVAYPQTITGSIGVFYGKLDLSGLSEKLGITRQLLTRGRFADIDSDARPLSPEARAKLRTSLEQVYKRFVTQVAEARGRTYDQIAPVAEGRVWLGSQAREKGLVDELGGISTALALAKKRAGIKDSDQVQLELYPQRPDLWTMLESQPWKLLFAKPALPSFATLWKRLPIAIAVE